MAATRQLALPAAWKNILWHTVLGFAVFIVPFSCIVMQCMIIWMSFSSCDPEIEKDTIRIIQLKCDSDAGTCALLVRTVLCAARSFASLGIWLLFELVALIYLKLTLEGAWGETWKYCVIGRYFGPKNLKMGHMEALEAMEKGECPDLSHESAIVSQ
ncbi:hypothetical protein DL98DRAFT_527724 [Cadophora sp. DSE1049]|nr:hypothetical protein DL98DRAFT_527724 [Cadophora sp. DSE1049]